MKRRLFTQQLMATGFGLGAAGAHAQGGPVEGKHYVRLAQPQPVAVPGKVEVVEFFWYGCPHCNAFEPLLNSWLRNLPADVSFRRVPVAFRPQPFEAHQRIYFALETMGRLDALHRRVFAAIHEERQRLDKPDEIADFMAKNGLDRAEFLSHYNSFSMANRVRQANQLSDAYKIDGVPSIGVNGQYYTSGPLAGSLDRMLQVVDFLVARSRKS